MSEEENKAVAALIKGGYLEQASLREAEAFSARYGSNALKYLLDEGIITKEFVGQAMAESHGLLFIDLRAAAPTEEQIRRLPAEVALEYRVVVVRQDQHGLTIATDDPARARPWMNKLKDANPDATVTLAYALTEDIDKAFVYLRPPLLFRIDETIRVGRKIAPEILKEVFSEALARRASDIHFEPREHEVLIRFRIDGLLQDSARMPKEHYESILNHVKLQARMRIDEHTAAQDGAMRYQDGENVDMRVSVAPTLDGEKIVIRILSEYIQGIQLAALGLSTKHHQTLLEALHEPTGMILVAGPTGSGKTTTLYALLKNLDRREINVTTIEDPVEYKVPGVTQMQVDPQAALTFASGLRSIVRQDPNVILVGEIRDTETAEITVNAALTGHRLLSTIHANDAATVIPRLLDMGVEPFLLASTLRAIVAQRLVRKICTTCRVTRELPVGEGRPGKRARAKAATAYYGKGCDSCHGTGYRGRSAIFEVIVVSPAIQDLILKRPSMREIWAVARREGALTLHEDGLEKVRVGITTAEEAYRVARPYAP